MVLITRDSRDYLPCRAVTRFFTCRAVPKFQKMVTACEWSRNGTHESRHVSDKCAVLCRAVTMPFRDGAGSAVPFFPLYA